MSDKRVQQAIALIGEACPGCDPRLEAYLRGCAPNSLRAVASDFRVWSSWRDGMGLPRLPASATEIRDFLRHALRDGRGRSPDTLARMLSTLSALHVRVLGVPDPTKDAIVSGEMKEMRRMHGRPPAQAAAIRIRGDVEEIEDEALPFSVESMISALENEPSLWAARARFMLSLGSDLGRRRSEFVAFDVGDLSPAPDGSGTIVIDRSKTDQDGRGSIKYLSPRTMALFGEWKTARSDAGENLTSGSALLISVTRYGRPGSRLSESGFNRAVKDIVLRALPLADPNLAAEQVDKVAAAVSGHSFRVGFAQDLVAANESLAAICKEGDWTSEAMPIRYSRHLAARSGAVARLRRRLS